MDLKKRLFSILVLLLICGLWIVVPWLYKLHLPWFPLSGFLGPTINLEALFSPVNALFSGLAFWGLVVTIWVQMRTSYKQSFASNFYQLLSVHKQNVGEVRFHSTIIIEGSTDQQGRSSFRTMYRLLGAIYEEGANTSSRFDRISPEHVKFIQSEVAHYKSSKNKKHSQYPHYATFNLFTKEIVSHLHRNVYHILKYINESELAHEDKKNYVRILRAQFNNYEFVILFYSTLFHRQDAFKKLVEKYEFFHNLDKGLLIDASDQTMYNESAYGDKGYEEEDSLDQYSVILDLSH